VSSPVQDAYARGVLDGRVETRLDHHAEQIAATNALLDRTVEIAQTQAATVQTLTEARVTDAATRVATAEAVKEAKNAQEAAATTAWTPMAKLIAVVGAVGVVFGIVVGLWALFGV
jgi:ElaB/YqjD/DUF883 family membrane-anchored ribosome-binding protein